MGLGNRPHFSLKNIEMPLATSMYRCILAIASKERERKEIEMKFTKTSERQMCEFFGKMDAMGCVPVTEWVSGSGHNVSPKALPPFVERFERKEYKAIPMRNTPERAAYEFFDKNHRRRAVLVMDIMAAMSFFFEAAHGKEF